MNTLILSLHIAIASLLMLSALRVLFAAWQQHATKIHAVMLTSFVATLVSGVALLFVGVGGIGRICAAMTAVTFATLLVSRYYRARVAAIEL